MPISDQIQLDKGTVDIGEFDEFYLDKRNEKLYRSKMEIYWKILVVSLGSAINGYCSTLYNNLSLHLSKDFLQKNTVLSERTDQDLCEMLYLMGAIFGCVLSLIMLSRFRKGLFYLSDCLV